MLFAHATFTSVMFVWLETKSTAQKSSTVTTNNDTLH